jgi:hypothetical protein
VEPRLSDDAADIGAERPVHGGPHLVVILEGEADAVDRGDRHIGRENEAGQVEHLDRAGAQLRQHVGVAAELAVGEQLDLHPPAALLLDPLDGFPQADIHGMGDDIVVGVAEHEFGGVAAPGENAECGNAGRRAGRVQQGAACHCAHGRILWGFRRSAARLV